MSQAVASSKGGRRKGWTWALRLIGFALLVFVLNRTDIPQVLGILRAADPALIVVAALSTIPLIWLKTVRWETILQAQGIRYRGWSPFLAYFGSLFVGFLTPGRLGEFVKAFHVQRERDVPLPIAFTSVLADRLFDLFALVTVGGMAVLSLSSTGSSVGMAVGAFAALLIVPLLLFLNKTFFSGMQRIVGGWGRLGAKLFDEHGWLTDIHRSLRNLTPLSIALSVLLTLLAYGVFYTQNFLLAKALGIDVNFVTTSYAVALGSLITLLPISISGLGTREAVMIFYLGIAGIAPEQALGFSLLAFFTFYICGGLIGLAAWLIKPIPWSTLRTEMNTTSDDAHS